MGKANHTAADWLEKKAPASKPVAKKRNTHGYGSENMERKILLEWFELQYPGQFVYVAKDDNMQGAGNMHKNSTSGHPDLTFYHNNGAHTCLHIELKAPDVKLRKVRHPEKWAKAHYAGQAEYLQHLRNIGHAAVFAVGEPEAREIINAYFAGQDVNKLSKHPLSV